jgi:hypothetical protein
MGDRIPFDGDGVVGTKNGPIAPFIAQIEISR